MPGHVSSVGVPASSDEQNEYNETLILSECSVMQDLKGEEFLSDNHKLKYQVD